MKVRYQIFLHAILMVFAVSVPAQDQTITSTFFRLQAGVDFYAMGLWEDALGELRYVEAETLSAAQKSEALFWIGMTELSARNFDAAVRSFDTLEAFDPESRRMADVPYHKGRALFNLSRFDESIVELGRYIDSLPVDRNGVMDGETEIMKASALYWIAECLFAMGHLDRADEIFNLIIGEYPDSFKYEASYYRIALIAQKRVESELLELLGWTHEESVKTMEEYQRREHAYEQALIAYQRRIAEISRDSRLSELESENAVFRQRLAASEERVRNLETELGISPSEGAAAGSSAESRAADAASRLTSLRSMALDLLNHIEGSEEYQR